MSHMDHDDPELRAWVRAKLLYPATDPTTGERVTFPFRIDPRKQAAAMADNGFTLGDIATFQGVSIEQVRIWLGEAA